MTDAVEVLHSYSNPKSQVDEAIDSVAATNEPLSASGPSWQPGLGYDSSFADKPPLPQAHALNHRLTADQRREIAAAFNNGTPQKELAATYGISIRNVKRLVHAARQKTQ